MKVCICSLSPNSQKSDSALSTRDSAASRAVGLYSSSRNELHLHLPSAMFSLHLSDDLKLLNISLDYWTFSMIISTVLPVLFITFSLKMSHKVLLRGDSDVDFNRKKHEVRI